MLFRGQSCSYFGVFLESGERLRHLSVHVSLPQPAPGRCHSSPGRAVVTSAIIDDANGNTSMAFVRIYAAHELLYWSMTAPL